MDETDEPVLKCLECPSKLDRLLMGCFKPGSDARYERFHASAIEQLCLFKGSCYIMLAFGVDEMVG